MNPFIPLLIAIGLMAEPAQGLPQYASHEEIVKLQQEYALWQERLKRSLPKAQLKNERQKADAAKNQCQIMVNGMERDLAEQDRKYQIAMAHIRNLQEEAERKRLGKEALKQDLADQRRSLRRCEEQSNELRQRSTRERAQAKVQEISSRLARVGVYV
jgi:hypothetical protein